MEENSEVDIAVGHQVQLLRLQKRIPLEDLAKSIGISLDEYRQYELGKSRFNPNILIKLCKVLQIRPARIFSKITID